MKILMICTEKLPIPPVLGGAIQTYIAGALPHIGKHHDITVLGITDPSLPDQETINGIHYVRVPGKILEIYREGVVNYVAANQFDLIHVFNRPRLIMPIRNVAPNAKITLSMHNDMFNPEKIEPEEAEAALAEISNIVTVSDYVGNVISELYPQAAPKLNTIYSGVDTDRFLPGSHSKMQSTRNEIRKAHDLSNKTVIMFAGRLSRNKGVDKLVRALPELSKKHKDLALVIVGSKWFSQNDVTDFVAYVRALANKLSIPVVTTGFVSPAEIQNWYAAADLFVCTSIWQEPLARVHYEAMAAGLPIITTARGGNPEVILVGENGYIVEDPTNPLEFAEKISHVLSDKSLMKNMGRKGRELAETLYEWDRVANQLLDVWDRSIKETPAEASQPGVATTQPVVGTGNTETTDVQKDIPIYLGKEKKTTEYTIPKQDKEKTAEVPNVEEKVMVTEPVEQPVKETVPYTPEVKEVEDQEFKDVEWGTTEKTIEERIWDRWSAWDDTTESNTESKEDNVVEWDEWSSIPSEVKTTKKTKQDKKKVKSSSEEWEPVEKDIWGTPKKKEKETCPSPCDRWERDTQDPFAV